MLQFLGGVDPNLVMASFAFTAITMVGIGGLSVFNSVIYKRPRDSIAITYLLLLAYIGLSTALVQYHPPSIFVRGGPPANWEERLNPPIKPLGHSVHTFPAGMPLVRMTAAQQPWPAEYGTAAG